MIAAILIPGDATVLEALAQARRAGGILATDGRRIVIRAQPLPAGWRLLPVNTTRIGARPCAA